MPYGVTTQMIDAWGQVVFDLSLNKQVRRGDPVRQLDHAAWVAQRDATGLTDDEIAARIGLARPQVTFIRNVLERRVFRTNQYRKLYRLGGGLRWRPDDYVDPEEAYAVRPEAALLRQALAFDRERVAAYVGSGAWTAETLWDRVAAHARDRGGDPAVAAGNERLTWSALAAEAAALAGGLAARNVGRGEAVALALPPGADAIGAIIAVWRLGGVVLPLPAGLDESAAAELLHRGRVRAVIFDPARDGPGAAGFARIADMLPALSLLATGTGGASAMPTLQDIAGAASGRPPVPPVAGDLALLLAAGGRLVPHTHQTLLAGARSAADTLGETPAAVAWRGDWAAPGFAVALGHWLITGAPLAIDAGAAPDQGLDLAPTGASAAGPAAVVAVGTDGKRLVTMAECPALLAGDGDEESDTSARRWQPLPGIELRLAADGEIEARGPAQAPGYVDDPAASAARFRPGGWLRTGLRGALDDGAHEGGGLDGGAVTLDGVEPG